MVRTALGSEELFLWEELTEAELEAALARRMSWDMSARPRPQAHSDLGNHNLLRIVAEFMNKHSPEITESFFFFKKTWRSQPSAQYLGHFQQPEHLVQSALPWDFRLFLATASLYANL